MVTYINVKRLVCEREMSKYEETKATLLGTDINLDTAFVLRIVDEKILKRFFQKHPIERFLFGTDSPFTDQKTELRFLNNLPFLTLSQKKKIAGQNATRLLNIGSFNAL